MAFGTPKLMEKLEFERSLGEFDLDLGLETKVSNEDSMDDIFGEVSSTTAYTEELLKEELDIDLETEAKPSNEDSYQMNDIFEEVSSTTRVTC